MWFQNNFYTLHRTWWSIEKHFPEEQNRIIITFSNDQPLKQQCTNPCLRSKRGQLTCKALEETKSSTAVGGSSSSSATQHQTCANSPAASPKQTSHSPAASPKQTSHSPAASPKQTSHSPTSSPKQTSNTTSYSPAPSPISTTPNSPKPVSPTPSLLFRSREASSDGSTSPCNKGSFLNIL